MNALMIRASWPSSRCDEAFDGEHGWVMGTHGIICERCYDHVAWADCRPFLAWCAYVQAQGIATVERHN